MPFDNWLRKMKDKELVELFDDLVSEFADRGLDIEEIYNETHPDEMRLPLKKKSPSKDTDKCC